MIDFFEFLNTCSPLRATSYMGFLLIFAFITYTFIDGIVKRIVGKNCECEEEVEEELEEEVEDTRQQLND